MKIAISAAIFNNFSSRMLATASIYNALAVQKGLTTEDEVKSSHEGLLAKVPFFCNMKEKVTKIAKVTKTEEELVIDINDEYIIGSIHMAFNLYDRIADSATTMIKEIGKWEKQNKEFEAKWASEPTEDKLYSTVLHEAAVAKSQLGKITQFKCEDYVATAAGEKAYTIYAKDVDKQIIVTALSVKRNGEDLPYELSSAVVKCICQSEHDPLFFVGGSYDLPLGVINAVRLCYSLPQFETEEQVNINKDMDEAKRKVEFHAKAEEDRKQKLATAEGVKEEAEAILSQNKTQPE